MGNASTVRDRHRAEQQLLALRARVIHIPTEFAIRKRASEEDPGVVVGHVFKTQDGREYARRSNGQILAGSPKVKGKAAVKAYKRARQLARKRQGVSSVHTPAIEWNGASDVLV